MLTKIIKNKIRPSETESWKELKTHYKSFQNQCLKKLFEEDKNRFEKYSFEFQDLLFDFSKQLIDDKTLKLLVDLAEECQLKEAINQQFNGKFINETENRAVLHTALRQQGKEPVFVKNEDVIPKINKVLDQMECFSNRVINGDFKGFTGKQITDVVNIGIGGSDLGPKMVCKALLPYKTRLNVHFVSNVDATDITEKLKGINPETTLFIVASKSFTTQETMTNAYTAREWFVRNGDEKEIQKHFVALSTNIEKVVKFGISKDNIFEFWDWVGGRYSLWSAIGLSVCMAIGFDNFKKLQQGAFKMDQHFKNSKLDQNIPVIMAMLNIWYNNFYEISSMVVVPYDQYMNQFTAYLQQVDMESNGKSIDKNGEKVNYRTGSIIWGDAGTNGQHAYFQLLHQGTQKVPVDFIATVNSHNDISDHHVKLLSNFLAQSEALAFGKTEQQVIAELKSEGCSDSEIQKLKNHKIFEGNRPSTSILCQKLTPEVLGSLIATYEHKIFVEGTIYNIYSFDQWGVELGKQLSEKILPELSSNEKIQSHDSSTNGLMAYFKRHKK